MDFWSACEPTHMQYDPIKQVIGNVVRENVLLRKVFYKLLGVMFLREWHVKRELRTILRKERTPGTHL